MSARQRHIAHLHLHAALSEAQYGDMIELMSGITPHVQAVPPDAVQLDLTSALRYFDLSPYDMVQTAMMRLKLFYDIDSSAGLANNRMLASMAADASAPGDTTWVPDGQAADHLVADLVFERDCLDPARHHRAVLGLAEQIGRRLRGEGRIATRLALTVRYADRSSTTRTRGLPEPTNHSPALATTALGLLTALGLQRARVRAFAIRADGLLPAGSAYRQLSLDPGDARARAAEAAADRARRRFGQEAVGPAALRTDRYGPG